MDDDRDLKAKVIAKIDELSEQGLSDLWNMLSRRLPDKAPALWSERASGREVTAVDFIRTHYADWLPAERDNPESGGPVLTRAHLGVIDPPLYTAYAVWIKRHPEDDLKLPTNPHVKVRSTSAPRGWVPTANLSETDKQARRQYEAERKRARRLKTPD